MWLIHPAGVSVMMVELFGGEGDAVGEVEVGGSVGRMVSTSPVPVRCGGGGGWRRASSAGGGTVGVEGGDGGDEVAFGEHGLAVGDPFGDGLGGVGDLGGGGLVDGAAGGDDWFDGGDDVLGGVDGFLVPVGFDGAGDAVVLHLGW